MDKIEVGKVYKDGAEFLKEGIKIDLSEDGFTVIISLKDPSENEIQNVKNGKLKVGYFSYKDVLLFLFKFGDMNWMDAPFNINLSKTLELQELSQDHGYACTIILINSNDAVVKGIRLIGLSNAISNRLKREINIQKEDVFIKSVYATNLQMLYTKKTKDIIKLSYIDR